MGLAFCLFAILLYAFLVFVLPVLVIILIVKWVLRLGKPRSEPEKRSAEKLTSDRLKTRFMEEARVNASAASVAAGATAEPAAAQEKKSGQPGIAAGSRKMVSQGEGLRNAAINKVALVQYMDYAASEGRDEALMLSTLKEKGWPDSEVADAFRSFKLLHGQA